MINDKIIEIEQDILNLKEINNQLSEYDKNQIFLSKNNQMIKNLESELIELKEIIETISYLIDNQAKDIDQIDQNVVYSKENTEISLENIKKALEYKKTLNKQLIKTLTLTTIGGLCGCGIGSIFGIGSALCGGGIGSLSLFIVSYIKK